jgi:hypothetical protein
MVEYWPTYAKAKAEFFGKGRIKRFWRKRIYPRLYPDRWAKQATDWEKVRARMLTEFFNAVIEKANQ